MNESKIYMIEQFHFLPSTPWPKQSTPKRHLYSYFSCDTINNIQNLDAHQVFCPKTLLDKETMVSIYNGIIVVIGRDKLM